MNEPIPLSTEQWESVNAVQTALWHGACRRKKTGLIDIPSDLQLPVLSHVPVQYKVISESNLLQVSRVLSVHLHLTERGPCLGPASLSVLESKDACNLRYLSLLASVEAGNLTQGCSHTLGMAPMAEQASSLALMRTSWY